MKLPLHFKEAFELMPMCDSLHMISIRPSCRSPWLTLSTLIHEALELVLHFHFPVSHSFPSPIHIRGRFQNSMRMNDSFHNSTHRFSNPQKPLQSMATLQFISNSMRHYWERVYNRNDQVQHSSLSPMKTHDYQVIMLYKMSDHSHI